MNNTKEEKSKQKEVRYETVLKVLLTVIAVLSLFLCVTGLAAGTTALKTIQNRTSHLGKLAYKFPYNGFDNGMTQTETISLGDGRQVISMKTYKNNGYMEQITVRKYASDNFEKVLDNYFSDYADESSFSNAFGNLPSCVKNIKVFSNDEKENVDLAYYTVVLETDAGIYMFDGRQIDGFSSRGTVESVISSLHVDEKLKDELYKER